MKRDKTETSSLVSPQNRGGVTGGDGYGFQEMYLVMQVPRWLADSSFEQVVLEGFDDIDVRFGRGGGSSHELVQVKDHHMAPSEVKDVLARFQRKEKASPGAFSCFSLACPNMSEDISVFFEKVDEYRRMSKMCGSATFQPIRDTLNDLRSEASELGLPVDVDFLIEKVRVDRSVMGADIEEVSRAVFGRGLRQLERWSDASVVGLDLAYEGLVTKVKHSRRTPLARGEIETLVEERIALMRRAPAEVASIVHLHNWSIDSYDVPPDLLFDWSAHFDRSSRTVPPPSVWEEELLPVLDAAERELARSGGSKLIQLRASACLSSGLAFGRCFAEVAGYTVELRQTGQTWRSDAPPEIGYGAETLTEEGNDPSSEDLLVVIAVTADPWADVSRYVAEIALCYRAVIRVHPQAGACETALASAEQALALATQTKKQIRDLRSHYGLRGVNHLFLNGPIGFAVFLGQKLRSAGEFQCYEHRNVGYSPSCRLPA